MAILVVVTVVVMSCARGVSSAAAWIGLGTHLGGHCHGHSGDNRSDGGCGCTGSGVRGVVIVVVAMAALLLSSWFWPYLLRCDRGDRCPLVVVAVVVAALTHTPPRL